MLNQTVIRLSGKSNTAYKYLDLRIFAALVRPASDQDSDYEVDKQARHKTHTNIIEKPHHRL